MSRVSIKNILRENIQQADKVYFKSGKLSPEARDLVLSITNGDYLTKPISDLCYFYFDGDEDESKFGFLKKRLQLAYTELKNYNPNVLPIKNLSLDNILQAENFYVVQTLEERATAIKELKKLPSIATRNLKSDIRQERNYREMNRWREDLQYFTMQYSMLDNRDESARKKIDAKIFKAGSTLNDWINFADEKENMLGGVKFTRNMVKGIINSNQEELSIIYDNNDVMVVEVSGPNGIKEIGCNSLWCFTYGSAFQQASRQWDKYSTNDMVYVIIDFKVDSSSNQFMHVLIKPLDYNWKYSDDEDDYKHNEEMEQRLFDMSNESMVDPILVVDNLIGVDTAKKLFTFGEEPKHTPKPFVDPNQLSLFEIRKSVRKKLLEAVGTNEIQSELDKIIAKYESMGMHIFAFLQRDYGLTIDSIKIINKTDRRKGIGSAFMTEITQFMDKYHLIGALSPSTKDGSSKAGLLRFYKGFGFITNKGKDFRFMHSMIRLPKE